MQYTDLGIISYKIQKAANSQEVYNIWLDNFDKVSGSKLIYASRDPVGIVIPIDKWGIVSKTDAYPRSLYNSPNLFLLSDEIVAGMEEGRPTPVKADVTVVLDSNVVDEIFRFVKGEPIENKDIEEILNFLITENINFNYNFFILENARRYYMKPGHAAYVYKKLYCMQFFDYLDKEKYLGNGQRTPTIGRKELTEITEKKLFEIFQTDSRKRYIKYHLRLHYFIYLSLLKIIEIEFAYARKPVEKKIEMLLEFMSHRLQRIFRRELYLALSYFKNRNSTNFLQKINTNCKEPLEKLSNIAWDMMIFRIMEHTATVETENGQVIPYFISSKANH